MRVLKALLLLMLGLTSMLHVQTAHACGAFARPRQPMETEAQLAARLPFLTVEQVLLLWDKETGIEDFIRETRFDRANQIFGFVVPTPTKPEVAAVKKAPFEALRKAYEFEPPLPPSSTGTSGGLGAIGGGTKGSGAGAEPVRPPPVVVLSEQRIGSFTAFTLATTDAGAFDKWLNDNGFAMTEEAKPWIARYIEQQFFFVALRYEPKVSADAGANAANANADAGDDPPTPEMTSETIRIRFKTPHPYYPYMEPALSKDALSPYSRMLTGWLVTREPMNAVAYKAPTETESRRFKRPWTTGLSYRVSTEDLAKVVGAELRPVLPKTTVNADGGRASLVIQTFRDLKTRRTGFGDVVLVPKSVTSLSSEDEEVRKFLLPVLDPTLLSAAGSPAIDAGEPAAAPAPPPRPAPSSAQRSTGCSSAPSSSASSPAFLLLLLLLIATALLSRRRLGTAIACAGMLACRPTNETTQTKPETGVANIQPIPIPTREPTREEKIRTVYALLSGEEPDGGVVIDSEQSLVRGPKGDAQVGISVQEATIPNVERVVAGMRGRFRQCYQRGMENDPGMSGKVVVSGEIAPDGSVGTTEVVSNTGLSPAVASCCAQVLHRAQFDAPTTGAKTKITFPITFVPQQ